MMKRIISLLLATMLIAALSVPAYAHDVPDFDEKGSIAVNMTYLGSPVPGGKLTIYRVADVVHSQGNFFFRYTNDFKGCSIPVTELDSAEIGPALAKIVEEKKLSGYDRTLDQNGHTRFSDLKLGLYLIIQTRAAYGFNPVTPFLVSVPGNNNGTYIYDVDASPKVGLVPAPTPTPTPPPGGYLPQTGLLNWPVPVMAALGFVLLSAGVCLKVSGRRKKYEE